MLVKGVTHLAEAQVTNGEEDRLDHTRQPKSNVNILFHELTQPSRKRLLIPLVPEQPFAVYRG